MEGSIIEFIGYEIISIISLVSICLIFVVLLLSFLPSPSSSSSSSSPAKNLIFFSANFVYDENAIDSAAFKLIGAVENATVFILLSMAIVKRFSIVVDEVSFSVFMFNFAVVGAVSLSVDDRGVPIVVTQGFNIVMGIMVTMWFVRLPEWTTWVLLIVMAVEDLVMVLAPRGQLRNFAELVQSRNDNMPGFGYQTRPTVIKIVKDNSELGLGDFVLYSVLVGRAAMYNLMSAYASYLAVIIGLSCTIILSVGVVPHIYESTMMAWRKVI